MSALPPKADIVEFEPVALRRKGRVGLHRNWLWTALERVGLQYHSLRQPASATRSLAESACVKGALGPARHDYLVISRFRGGKDIHFTALDNRQPNEASDGTMIVVPATDEKTNRIKHHILATDPKEN
jgi:hypothetical protein